MMHDNLAPLARSDEVEIPPLYSYQPLNRQGKEIRLLCVRNWHRDSSKRHFNLNRHLRPRGDPYYEMVHVDLDTAPPFEAISYAWGSPARTHSIRLINNGGVPRSLLLTSSIAEALPYLLSASLYGRLWIDQLCINQDSVEERNHQVTLMGAVYSGAKRTLLWTGGFSPLFANRGRDYYLVDRDLINFELSDCPKRFLRERTLSKLPAWLVSMFLERSAGSYLYSPSDAEHFVEFFSRPWFKRAWVVQEAVLAKEPIWLAGDTQLQLPDVTNALVAGEHWPAYAPHSVDCAVSLPELSRSTNTVMQQILLLRVLRPVYGGRIVPRDVPEFLNIMATCQATDPRDHVYAFLGLGMGDIMPLGPDYSLDTSTVFTQAALVVINGTGELLIFEHFPRGLGKEQGEAEEIPLPSWVPDWTTQAQPNPLIRDSSYVQHVFVPKFDAAKDRPHIPAQSLGTLSGEIGLAGRVVDRVIAKVFLIQTATENQPVISLHDILYPVGKLDEIQETRENLFERMHTVFSHLFSAIPDNFQYFLEEITSILNGQMVFLCQSGSLGIGSTSVRQDDNVTILHGSKLPVVIRPAAGGKYTLVGLCYLEGAMEGEAVTWEEDGGDVITLI